MAATSLRACLNSLGSSGTSQIEYIEISYGKTDFLDNVCDAINPGSIFNQALTETQPDSCTSGSSMMYPSYCSQGWLGGDCFNGCGNANYAGFYCTGKELCYREFCRYSCCIRVVAIVANL